MLRGTSKKSNCRSLCRKMLSVDETSLHAFIVSTSVVRHHMLPLIAFNFADIVILIWSSHQNLDQYKMYETKKVVVLSMNVLNQMVTGHPGQ